MDQADIRVATPGDVTAIRRIARQGWNAAYDAILSEATVDAAIGEWYDAETVRAFIEREEVGYFVAEEGGTVVGYVSGGPGESTDVASLGAIYVDPDRWGEGVGTALLDRFEAFCREQGYESVQCRVLSKNHVAMAFYMNRGYEVVAERETDLFGESVTESQLSARIA